MGKDDRDERQSYGRGGAMGSCAREQGLMETRL